MDLVPNSMFFDDFLHEVDFRVLINLAESNLSWIGSELESRAF